MVLCCLILCLSSSFCSRCCFCFCSALVCKLGQIVLKLLDILAVAFPVAFLLAFDGLIVSILSLLDK